MSPKGTDYTLSLIWLIKPSFKTRNRLVSEPSSYPIITDLGSKYADCPIFFIITIPELITLGHLKVSNLDLVEKAIRGFPNNKICRSIWYSPKLLADRLGKKFRGPKWFSIARARFAIAFCFLALSFRSQDEKLRPPIPLIIRKTL